MAAIAENFGFGGSGLTPGGGAGSPTLATALRDVADDLAGLKVATIATADADATYGTAEADLINEIKTALNAVAGYTIKTTKS